jgi:hypothetical protein
VERKRVVIFAQEIVHGQGRLYVKDSDKDKLGDLREGSVFNNHCFMTRGFHLIMKLPLRVVMEHVK